MPTYQIVLIAIGWLLSGWGFIYLWCRQWKTDNADSIIINVGLVLAMLGPLSLGIYACQLLIQDIIKTIVQARTKK